MKHLYLQLVATSPVAIRADHAEGGAASAPSIPGTTLRGSLAAAHQLLYPTREREFARLFLDEQVSFPHLYPAVFKQSHAGLETANLPVKPLPKTAQTCKRFPGFRPLRGEETVEERHGIRDSLLDWAVFSLLDAERQPLPSVLAPLQRQVSCTFGDCKQAIDHADGYYRSARYRPRQRMRASSQTRLQTRTGINRNWGVVEEGILYNREVFEDGMLFWGELLFPEEEELPDEERRITLFTSFLQEAILHETEPPGFVRIGTGRTRGLGCVALKSPTVEVAREPLAAFQQRLERFNTMLQDEAREMGVKELDAFYFAVTLSSATILCDPFLRYQKTLDAATLERLLHCPQKSLRQVYQATGIQQITGWNDLWGTPRSSEYALEMGSTCLFASTMPLTPDLLEALYALEETGIGRRRAEGFGRMCISDPFHLERGQL